jgi:hypothetical protein
MAFIHTLRNRPSVVCFLPSSNYPPETKFSRPNSTPHSQTSSDNKNKRRRNPPPKTKPKKNLTKHPNTVQPLRPPPVPSSSQLLLPPNYKTQNLILMLPNKQLQQPKIWAWCFLTTTTTTTTKTQTDGSNSQWCWWYFKAPQKTQVHNTTQNKIWWC